MRYWLVLVLLLAMTVPAVAQDTGHRSEASFRVTWQSDRNGAVPWLEGRVFNTSPLRVTNVRVQIEGLDGEGRVLSKNVAWALGDIAPGAETSFRTQPVSGAVDYHARVVAYDVVSRAEAL